LFARWSVTGRSLRYDLGAPPPASQVFDGIRAKRTAVLAKGIVDIGGIGEIAGKTESRVVRGVIEKPVVVDPDGVDGRTGGDVGGIASVVWEWEGPGRNDVSGTGGPLRPNRPGNFRALGSVHTFVARCILLSYSEDKFLAPKFLASKRELPAAQIDIERRGPIRTYE